MNPIKCPCGASAKYKETALALRYKCKNCGDEIMLVKRK